MGGPSAAALPQDLDAWLQQHAESLDTQDTQADALLPRLGGAGLFGAGVPAALGGDGAPLSSAIAAIAAVAQRSLAAAFVLWGQRAFIEYVLQADGGALRERHLADLLAGRTAGATGLSNAMKHLSGLEALGVQARASVSGLVLDGRVRWATNLRPAGFLVAVAVAREDGSAFVAALAHDEPGLARSEDLDLIALRGTRTAALQIASLQLSPQGLVAADARRWLPRVRPAFLGLQCGLSIGVARAALAAARQRSHDAKAVLGTPIGETAQALEAAVAALHTGVDDGRFVAAPVPLFELRITLAELAQQAVQLELQASGGRAYQRDGGLGFARRWREAAFLPIVTPSLAQLRGELLKHRAAAA